MKRFTGLLLILALLLALSAPALAREVLSEGQYTVEANLDVPEDALELGAFTVTIPSESIGIQYGETEKQLYYAIDIDREKFPEAKKVQIELTAEHFHEWHCTYEETGWEGDDWGCFLHNDDFDNYDNDIGFDLYADNGSRRLMPAPYDWGEYETPLFGGYDRHVDAAINFEGEDAYSDGNILMAVHYDALPNPQPGHYHSSITFNVSTGWAFNKDDFADMGYEYILAEGREDRIASDWDDETAAFDPNGWPFNDGVTGYREKT